MRRGRGRGRRGRGGRGRRGRGWYQWRPRDYRRIRVIWDYENLRLAIGFDVSRIVPTLRRILRSHRNRYYGDISVEAVVSDGSSSDKIEPAVFNALDEEDSIDLHDLETRKAQFVSKGILHILPRNWIQ